METLTKEQIEILKHTKYGAANRHFCGDSEDMQVLVKLGLMKPIGKKSFVPDEYFTLTTKGLEVLNGGIR